MVKEVLTLLDVFWWADVLDREIVVFDLLRSSFNKSLWGSRRDNSFSNFGNYFLLLSFRDRGNFVTIWRRQRSFWCLLFLRRVLLRRLLNRSQSWRWWRRLCPLFLFQNIQQSDFSSFIFILFMILMIFQNLSFRLYLLCVTLLSIQLRFKLLISLLCLYTSKPTLRHKTSQQSFFLKNSIFKQLYFFFVLVPLLNKNFILFR